jgi:chemotaxis signal transduction protein
MTSDEAVEALEELPEEGRAAEEGEARERFFIFSVGESRFALPPTAIREIVSDLEVFPIPACPPYVAGLINCHGTPFAVLDLKVLLESERLAAAQFLVLNVEGDSLAFGCTDVDEIVELPLSCVTAFADKDAESRLCSSMLAVDGRRIPVLSVDRIRRQLESDLA